MERAYDEIVKWIAGGVSREKVARFEPSRKSKTRVASLIRREKTVGLSQDETDELNHFMQIEHIMRLAKARAALHLKHA